MASRMLRNSLIFQKSIKTSSTQAMSGSTILPRLPSKRSISNVASTSIYSAPAPLRMQPPTAEEETNDFTKACEEVQRWFDSPRFKGIKVNFLSWRLYRNYCLHLLILML